MRERLVQSLRWAWILLAGMMLLNPGHARANNNAEAKKKTKPANAAKKPKDFPIFDGRVYNGLFYPKIDIIEWNNKPEEPTHMQFQVYSKSKPVEMSFQLDDTTGKPVMMVRYHIVDRDEYVCRRVIAPGHFNGQKFFVYKDLSDKDMDNTLVSMTEMPEKKGMKLITPKPYEPCKEEDEEEDENVATEEDETAGGDYKNIAPPGVDSKRAKTKTGALKSDEQAVPFGDW